MQSLFLFILVFITVSPAQSSMPHCLQQLLTVAGTTQSSKGAHKLDEKIQIAIAKDIQIGILRELDRPGQEFARSFAEALGYYGNPQRISLAKVFDSIESFVTENEIPLNLKPMLSYQLMGEHLYDPRERVPRMLSRPYAIMGGGSYSDHFSNGFIVIGDNARTAGDISVFSHDILGHLSAYVEFPELVEYTQQLHLERKLLKKRFSKTYENRSAQMDKRFYYLLEGLVAPKSQYTQVMAPFDILPQQIQADVSQEFSDKDLDVWAEQLSAAQAQQFFEGFVENFYNIFHLMGGSVRDTRSGMSQSSLHNMPLNFIEKLFTGYGVKTQETVVRPKSLGLKEIVRSQRHYPLLKLNAMEIDRDAFSLFVEEGRFASQRNKKLLIRLSLFIHRLAQISVGEWFSTTGPRYVQSSKIFTLLCRDPLLPQSSEFYVAFCSKEAFSLD